MTIDNINHETIEGTEQTDLKGKKIASLLDAHAKDLSMRTLKQLEDGRTRAVKAHSQQVSGVGINKDGTSSGIFAWAQHHRIASTGLILGVIIAGFVLMQAFSHHEASDAFLLGADLPPEAFVDRGFEPSLNNGKLEL
ncbi:MAG TPA: DUF3619 family protein [Methylotenera sp.]|jgi:hypothetical protein|nr:DUF3619 family protein [Methylotenera sp.]